MSGHKLSFGMIGCGRIAQAHFAAIEYLREEAELIAVADTDLEKARNAAQRFGAQAFSARYEDLLSREDVAAVIITLPNHLHHSAALAAARARKHILIEKPMALNTGEALAMVAEAKRHGVCFMVGQSRRFSQAVFELERRLPEIGNLFRIQISFLVHFPAPPTTWWKKQEEAGGLVIFLQGSHSLDSVLTWMKKMPKRVCTFSAKAEFSVGRGGRGGYSSFLRWRGNGFRSPFPEHVTGGPRSDSRRYQRRSAADRIRKRQALWIRVPSGFGWEENPLRGPGALQLYPAASGIHPGGPGRPPARCLRRRNRPHHHARPRCRPPLGSRKADRRSRRIANLQGSVQVETTGRLSGCLGGAGLPCRGRI